MKKDNKQQKSNGVTIKNLPEPKYQPKGPKTTTTSILANQLRNLPIEERAQYIEGLGRNKEPSKKRSGKN